MARRKRWTPVLDGTGSLNDVLDAFEAGLEDVKDDWNVHVDGYLNYAACCHALLKQPDKAMALVGLVRGKYDRQSTWAQVATFLARVGLVEPAMECVRKSEAELEALNPEYLNTESLAPLASAWALLDEPQKAEHFFKAARKSLENRHNHNFKINVLIRAHLLAGDYDTPIEILDESGWDSYNAKPYITALFHHDYKAGLELFKTHASAAKNGDHSALLRIIGIYSAEGRYKDAWEVIDLFDGSYTKTRQTLVREMFANGEFDMALQHTEASLQTLAGAKYPVDASAWGDVLAEYAPERFEAHRETLDGYVQKYANRYHAKRACYPMAHALIRMGDLKGAMVVVTHQRDRESMIGVLRTICAACHTFDVPSDLPMGVLTGLVEKAILEGDARQRLQFSLDMFELYAHMGDAEGKAKSLEDAYMHASNAPSGDKRFRFESIMKACIAAGDHMEAYTALKRMPAGSRKYEVDDLANAWIDEGHIKDALEAVLRVPHRKESPFRTFERTFRTLQYTNIATHPGLKELMPQ